ncbi:MAG: cupin [bacterium]|nr:cupin [bacterium]
MEKNQFDASQFSIEPHAEKLEKPWGWEVHWAKEPGYVGKFLHLNKGKRFSLQYHDKKEETQILLSGKVRYWLDNNQGELVPIDMEIGKGYTVKPLQRHRMEALEDSELVEVSLPESGTTYRLDDDYNRSNETEEVRNQPGRGWKP